MRTINVTSEDEEFAEIEKKKGDRNWRQYILDCTKGEAE